MVGGLCIAISFCSAVKLIDYPSVQMYQFYLPLQLLYAAWELYTSIYFYVALFINIMWNPLRLGCIFCMTYYSGNWGLQWTFAKSCFITPNCIKVRRNHIGQVFCVVLILERYSIYAGYQECTVSDREVEINSAYQRTNFLHLYLKSLLPPTMP